MRKTIVAEIFVAFLAAIALTAFLELIAFRRYTFTSCNTQDASNRSVDVSIEDSDGPSSQPDRIRTEGVVQEKSSHAAFKGEIPTYIINLKTRKERLSTILKRVNGTKPAPTIVEAVDGRDLRPSNNSLTRGEIGIFQSQMKALSLIAKNDALFGLILEDDASIVLPRDADAIYGFLREAPADIGVLSLGNNWMPPEAQRVSEHLYSLNGGLLLGTHAILYSKEAAQRIIDNRRWIETHVDQKFWYDLPFDVWLSSPAQPVTIYFVAPSFVNQTMGYSDTQGIA